MDVFARLKAFRQAVYDNLCRAHNAAAKRQSKSSHKSDAVDVSRQLVRIARNGSDRIIAILLELPYLQVAINEFWSTF